MQVCNRRRIFYTSKLIISPASGVGLLELSIVAVINNWIYLARTHNVSSQLLTINLKLFYTHKLKISLTTNKHYDHIAVSNGLMSGMTFNEDKWLVFPLPLMWADEEIRSSSKDSLHTYWFFSYSFPPDMKDVTVHTLPRKINLIFNLFQRNSEKKKLYTRQWNDRIL